MTPGDCSDSNIFQLNQQFPQQTDTKEQGEAQ